MSDIGVTDYKRYKENTRNMMFSSFFCGPLMSAGLEKPGVIEQVDLTPTLALGLGLPISQNSVGRVIPGVFAESSLRDQLRFLHLNGHQLNCLLKDSTPSHQKGKVPISERREIQTV